MATTTNPYNPWEALPGSNLNQFGQIGQAPIPNINKPMGPGYYYDQGSDSWKPTASTQQAGPVIGTQLDQSALTSANTKNTAADQALKLQQQFAGSLSGLGGGTGGSTSGSGMSTPPTVGFGGSGGSVGGVSAPSGPSTSGTPTFGPSSGGSVPNIQPAQDAAFARAKDAAGNESRASINSLNDEMAGRGALGSGITNQGLADRISASTNSLGAVNTAQMGDAFASAQHQQDLANSNQQLGFTGAITQRGQDIQAQTAQASLAQQKQLALANLLQLSLGGLTKLAS